MAQTAEAEPKTLALHRADLRIYDLVAHHFSTRGMGDLTLAPRTLEPMPMDPEHVIVELTNRDPLYELAVKNAIQLRNRLLEQGFPPSMSERIGLIIDAVIIYACDLMKAQLERQSQQQLPTPGGNTPYL